MVAWSVSMVALLRNILLVVLVSLAPIFFCSIWHTPKPDYIQDKCLHGCMVSGKDS